MTLVNLHTHLEGRIRPETAGELAAAAGVPAPDGGWHAALRLDGPADLTTYLAKVASSYPFFRSPAATERIAREVVIDAAASGLDYLELRFGPATHTDHERGIADVIAAVVHGIEQGSAASGMPAGAVVASLRHHDEETNIAVARAAVAFAGAGVVGFDLAGDERRFPRLDTHIPAFAIARAASLGITCHAAEAGPASAAREASELLGAGRIGHGAHIADDPDELRWAAASGLIVEVCPTSNWYTGAIRSLDEHPARRFRDSGVHIVLGDDNPIQTGSDLVEERLVLVDRLAWTRDDLADLDRVSVAAVFAEPAVRARLQARLDR